MLGGILEVGRDPGSGAEERLFRRSDGSGSEARASCELRRQQRHRTNRPLWGKLDISQHHPFQMRRDGRLQRIRVLKGCEGGIG